MGLFRFNPAINQIRCFDGVTALVDLVDTVVVNVQYRILELLTCAILPVF